MSEPRKTRWFFGLMSQRFILLPIVLGVGFLALLPSMAQAAASLYVAPPSGTFTLGSTFTVSIYLNTGGQAINAVEANLSFPPDKLQVVSPTTGRSLIQIWVAQPSYSNLDGTLKFRGTIPTPGINTDAGLISTVTFRVKSVGTAALKILDSSRVLLNDGRGTDILGQTTDGIYYLALPPPQGPIVTSRTNPDQENWYNTKIVSFEWIAPPDIQGYSYVLDQDPGGEPDDISEGIKTRVVYSNLADGVYYFHIKALRQGDWGGNTDYIVRVDNTAPAAFKVNFSPSDRTSNHLPIIDFSTTDAASGIDHYELKIVALDAPTALLGQNSTPFFIEVSPPYSRTLDDGGYDVVIRAYDRGKNYYQAGGRLTITKPFLDIISGGGLSIGGFILPWFYAGALAVVILVCLYYFGKWVWRRHCEIEEYIIHGILHHPSVAEKFKTLKEKQKEYGGSPRGEAGGKSLLVILGLIAVGFSVFLSHPVKAAQDSVSNVRLEPPVVTLFPKSISNDEILYIGGHAGAPQAQVLIYLQEIETGSTQNKIAVTDKDGAWFYSLPQFLDAGRYIAWTQLKVADEVSPPSSKLDLFVAPTAIQIGSLRLGYEDFYFILLLIFAIAFFGLLIFVIYHCYHFRKKSRRLGQAIRDAEDSIRRGFAVLRSDIEAEIDLVRRAKLKKELSAEEKLREEKLLKDFEAISRYINKEVWEINETSEK